MAYIPPTSHATLLATLRRERLLPVAGEVLVEARRTVEPSDVVARALVPESHVLVDVARLLGLPPERADRALVKAEGDPVKAGEPLAVRRGLFTRRARSPVNGRLVAAAEGKLLLAAMSEAYELRAGLPGVVASVTERRGVTIETTGALLEGVWGNAPAARPREDYAPLRLVDDNPRGELSSAKLGTDLRGAIVGAGMLFDAAALRVLADVRVRGLVLGSVVPGLLGALRQLEFPVIVISGFGRQGFSQPAFELLTSNAGRSAWIWAAPPDRFSGRRPELIVPLPSPAAAPAPVLTGQALAAGKRVRVLRGPLAGQVGTVDSLSAAPVTLPSGLRTRAAQVALSNGSGAAAAVVAFANLELLE
jgi:hypothetical protein